MSKTLRGQTILVIACTFKGADFIREAHRLGCRIYLITAYRYRDMAWPRECISEFFYVDEQQDIWNIPNLIKGVSYLARTIHFDKIVPLDDYDLEKASALREHLRVAGMGDTRVRYFRDKFAMRAKADEDGIPVPEFVHVLNYDRINAFTSMVSPPWLLKPRSKASVQGIIKVETTQALWDQINHMGDDQSFFLLERYIPGEVYHVEGIVYNFEVVFQSVNRYLNSPFEASSSGGIFGSVSVERGGADDTILTGLNKKVITSMGLMHGVTHTEFIKSAVDGQFYFLETTARVGGSYINEKIEAETGINLWKEWARIEALAPESKYKPPLPAFQYSGLILSGTREKHPVITHPDRNACFWSVSDNHQAGVIVTAPAYGRLMELIRNYTETFRELQ